MIIIELKYFIIINNIKEILKKHSFKLYLITKLIKF